MTELLTGLLELTLASSLLIALLLALTPALAKRFSPRWRYWVWLALALRLAVPVNVSLPAPLISLPAPGWAAADSPSPAEMVRELGPELPAEAVRPLPAGPETGVYAGNVHTPFLHSSQVTVVENGTVVTNWLRQSIRWPNVLFALWAAGTAVALIGQLVRHRAFLRLCRRWRREASPADRAEADRQAKALGLSRTPALYRCAAVATPMLTGLFRPVILLPAGLSGTGLSVALDHELTHWKRRDLWYKALLLWVRCLHWFNPLVRLMCRRAEADVEQCCDCDLLQGRSLSDRQAYGNVLLDQMTAGRPQGTWLATGFSGSRREVTARFKALLDTSAKKTGRAALTLVAALAVLCGGLVACQNTPQPTYDAETGLYRDEARSFAFTVPQTVWDQLEAIPSEDGDNWTVSFVSQTVKERLGGSFDPAEDFWLRVRLRHLEDGSTVRDVTYGAWDDLQARCQAAGMAQEDLDTLSELYAGAQVAYRTFIFLSSDSGGESAPAQQAGAFYYEDTEVYLNFDLGFGLDLPKEVYDQLIVVTDLRRSTGSTAVFLDRRLVEELGWDPDAMLDGRTVFLSVEQTADGLRAEAGDRGALDLHPEFQAADQAFREAVLETAGQAEAVAATLFGLDAADDGLAEGDTYDPRLLYGYRSRDDGVQISIPGWAMQQIRTSYDGGLLTFSTLAGDPLLYWREETGFSLPNLTSAELSDGSEAGVLAYMDLQDALLTAECRSGETGGLPLGTATIAYSIVCPDGTYPANLGGVSLNDGGSRLLFTPRGELESYYLPLAADAELKPLFPTPETCENEVEWVIFSGLLSSAFPYLEVTVEDNRIVALACVLGEGPAEQQP